MWIDSAYLRPRLWAESVQIAAVGDSAGAALEALEVEDDDAAGLEAEPAP